MITKIKQKIANVIYSGDNKLSLDNISYLPRWIVLGIDTITLIFSLVLSHLLIIDSKISYYKTLNELQQFGVILFVNVVFFFIYKTYSGLVRHSTFTDIAKLILASFSTLILLVAFNYVLFITTTNKVFLIPFLIFYAFVSFSFLLLFRVLVKLFYRAYKDNNQYNSNKKRIFIYGTSDQAISIAEALQTETISNFFVVGFLANKKTFKRIRILDKPVLSNTTNIEDEFEKFKINGLLIVEDTMSIKEKNILVNLCLNANVQIYNVPRIEKLQRKKDLNSQIRNIEIEDLLSREVIQIDSENIENTLKGKNILVTGGAGSIGSEIVRQVVQYKPNKIVVLDQAETALYDLELQLKETHPKIEIITELADVKNMFRLALIFDKYDFDIVYNAAAYKHVPIIEKNPHEAIYVNILGTINLVKLAISKNIDRFVMVSTDKAVNPTNVMGASKRAAEIYVQSIQNESHIKTKFITTRFGNVLGSNGSVIPHFKRQIAKGGPVTVTHPDIIRYFMTISEACQLVLQAGSMGNGGEIFVFDMGNPVRIMDLATRMIKLSGLQPNEDIKIEVTGLRPGEKLFEELLADTSINLPTHHDKIMIAKEAPQDFNLVKPQFEHIVKAALKSNDKEVVKLLKEIVKEFKSENSIYESLDLK